MQETKWQKFAFNLDFLELFRIAAAEDKMFL